MEIVSVDFEDKMMLEINGVKISIQPFKEHDENVIRLGVDAPRSVVVNREEIHLARKNQNYHGKSDEKVTGIVKSYNPKLGIGYAKVKYTNNDVLIKRDNFVIRQEAYNLWECDKIRMKIKRTSKGLMAEEVQLVK